MIVFVISESDYDSSWIVAVYADRALADSHVELTGGFLEECEVRDAIHPDATDPAKQAKRTREAEKARVEHERYMARLKSDAKMRAEVRPNPPHMSLCHCQVFSERPGHFWNAHGYCSYCGGFAPAVFRGHMGEAALHNHIDKLAEWDREKMRVIVASDTDRNPKGEISEPRQD